MLYTNCSIGPVVHAMIGSLDVVQTFCGNCGVCRTQLWSVLHTGKSITTVGESGLAQSNRHPIGRSIWLSEMLSFSEVSSFIKISFRVLPSHQLVVQSCVF